MVDRKGHKEKGDGRKTRAYREKRKQRRLDGEGDTEMGRQRRTDRGGIQRRGRQRADLEGQTEKGRQRGHPEKGRPRKAD